MRQQYTAPQIIETRQLRTEHVTELNASTIDVTAAGLSGVSSVDHQFAYDKGIRGAGDLGGLCYRYWDVAGQRFSQRFVRIKPSVQILARKYLQPVGERPRLYFVAGTLLRDLVDPSKSVFITEGEKKVLALDRAARANGLEAVVIGIGGVWGWRYSPRELQPNGNLDKGKSRSIADLNLIRWAGRKVYLFFDSDVATNWKVAVAETALARELRWRGADVFIVRI